MKKEKEIPEEIVNELWGEYIPTEEVRKSDLFKKVTILMYKKALNDNPKFFRKYGKHIEKYLEDESNGK